MSVEVVFIVPFEHRTYLSVHKIHMLTVPFEHRTYLSVHMIQFKHALLL